MDQANQMNKRRGTTKLRPRLPNPFMSIRPYFSTQRRWKNGTCGNLADDKVDEDNERARRVSIDHTASTRSIACSPNCSSPCNLDYGFATKEVHHVDNNAVPIRPRSISEPIPSVQQPGVNTTCPCLECSPSVIAQELQLPFATRSASPPVTSISTPRLSPCSNSLPMQSALHQSIGDSSLQARIEAIRIQQQYVGDNHPDVIFALSSLAKAQERRGNHVEAAAIWKESQMRMMLAKYASSHPMYLSNTCIGPNHPSTENYFAMVPTEISYVHRT
ncbi:hypothetical protein ACHAWU_010413 [Discostella pseudostelligera]|uniref:Kinesin light chain n=1 Tax=Discostella pseudostelligera TaxID=259834 RepID=A0ABD3LXW9_9STRA